MASMQKSHEERAQSAAQKAADELHASRQDQDREGAPVSPRGVGGGGGILGGVQESARSVMGAVQDSFSGERGGASNTHDDDDSAAGNTTASSKMGYAEEGKAKARGVADAAMGKAGETKDAAADRARGAMDAAVDKARGVGDAAADMATGNNKAGEADESEEDVMLRVKAADQMTGQAFNDVGPMGEEGTGVPRRRRSS